MRSHLVFPILFALVTAVACQGGVGPLSEEDVAANRALTQQFVQHAQQNDWAALADLYTEDCVVMPANEPTIQGRAAYLAWGETFPPIVQFSANLEWIEGYGDMAVVRGIYSMTVQPEGADAMTDQGKYVEVRRRQADGSWKIAVDIFNSDLPLPGQ